MYISEMLKNRRRNIETLKNVFENWYRNDLFVYL